MIRTIRAWFTSLSGTTPGTRFKRGDEPTEGNFKKLFESVAFIAEVDDTAKTTEQGLAKAVTDQDAIDKKSRDSSGMMRFVQPHQTTSVAHNPSSGVKVYPSESDRYQGGILIGKGKEYTISNDMQVSAGPSGSIVVTQTARGKDVIIDLNGNVLSSLSSDKYVRVDASDATSGYLLDKIQIEDESEGIMSLYAATPSGTARKLMIGLKPKWYEIKMIGLTTAQLAAIFPSSSDYHCVDYASTWYGWALCYGQLVAGNGTTMPDMRESVPIGRHNTTYPNSGTVNAHKDYLGVSGVNSYTLVNNNLPAHTHGPGTLATDTAATHTHRLGAIVNPGDGGTPVGDVPGATAGVDYNSDAGGAHSHGIAGLTDSNTTTNQAIDNRQKFVTVAFVMYIGG